jgi:phospholipase/carboxylesterase
VRTTTTEREDAVILAPAAGPADAAVIWMHGLGADGFDFVPMVPELNLPDSARVRFVFPHADVRPVTVNAGYAMRAWYDIRDLTPEGRDDEAGLAATRERIESCIAAERAQGIAARRIVLAGFSQGGATALHVGLRHAERLAGIIALSCYLPLRDRLATEALGANRATPILMCHGREDVVVLPAFGELSRDALLAAGLPVEWRAYSMGHNLCRPEIFDIAAWLRYHLALDPTPGQ